MVKKIEIELKNGGKIIKKKEILMIKIGVRMTQCLD